VVNGGVLKKACPAKKYLRREGKAPNRHNTAAIKPVRRIKERRECIERRQRLGDLEGDTVYGARGKSAMLTLAARKRKLLYAVLAGSRNSGVILEAFKGALWGHACEHSHFTFRNIC
jgi:IS30 family transposase